MKKHLSLILFIGLAFLVACSNNNVNETADTEELIELHVDFEVPETAEIDETIEVTATVTYGDDLVTDADEVTFEYWIDDNKDDSQTIESTNNGDGTYTAEITLEEEAVYSIYAHTTARGLHTMPKKSVIVGNAEMPEHHDEEDEHHDH